jgi:hypothetical protein
MRRPAIAAVLAIGAITGCTTLAVAPVKDLDALVGQSELALVQRLGVPTQTYAVGDRKFLSYQRRQIAVEPSTGRWWWWGWGAGAPPFVAQFDCDTTFEVTGAMVRSYTLRGNDCLPPFSSAGG